MAVTNYVSPTNKKTGKAVADVKALFFYKHPNGVEPANILATLPASSSESTDWFAVLSSKGSVNVSQDAPSIEKILVDQFDAPIGITTEPGDFTFEAILPSFEYNDLSKWLGNNVEQVTDTQLDSKQLVGLDLDGQTINVSVLIKTGTGASILFTNCQVVLSFNKEDKVFGFRLSGQVLAAEQESNKMIYIATEAPAQEEESSSN